MSYNINANTQPITIDNQPIAIKTINNNKKNYAPLLTNELFNSVRRE